MTHCISQMSKHKKSIKRYRYGIHHQKACDKNDESFDIPFSLLHITTCLNNLFRVQMIQYFISVQWPWTKILNLGFGFTALNHNIVRSYQRTSKLQGAEIHKSILLSY